MAHRLKTPPRPLLPEEAPRLHMHRRPALCALVLFLVLPLLAFGQSQDPPEIKWGAYTVHGSIELGGRITDVQGSEQLYETLVDLRSGPRLLEQELTMQSNGTPGLLFDNLYMSSFGMGGDPEGVVRLRLQKNRLYNFVALYRRDRNVFDYDLFANPMNLNAGVTTCGVGCTNAFTPSALPWFDNSTRVMNMSRNMGDFLLTLLPESVVSFRLGYSRNASYGFMTTTLEAPLRSLLGQDSQWRSDRYQFGFDLKGLPRTTFSGDVFLEHDKTDISYTDAVNQLYTIGNATGQQITFNGQPLPVDIGLLLPPLGGTLPSCAGANQQSIFSGDIFRLIAGCNGILVNSGAGGGYFRDGNVRTDIPTGQLAMQSNYFRNLDLSASFVYSSATSDFLNYNEFAHLNTTQPAAPALGTVSNTLANLFLINGTPSSRRVTTNADASATYHISKSLSISDKFRWVNWRQPGGLDTNQFGCFLPSGAAFATAVGTTGTLTNLLNPCAPAILALVNPSSGPPLVGTAGSVGNGRGDYLQTNTFQTLLGERDYFNTFKVNWQPSRRFSGYIGYRFTRRSLQDGNADISGILSQVTANFVNDGTGTVPTVSNCTTATPNPNCDPATGLISNLGGVDSSQLNQHAALFGVTVRPIDAVRINADLEWLYADNTFTNIYLRHQQRVRVYGTYKARPWLSFNGGMHFVETRNDFAAATLQDDNGATPDTPLFPASFLAEAYGHKDHWRYYTLGSTMTKQKLTFDIGWTMLDQNIRNATCMPVANNAFSGSVTPPPSCNNGAVARALLLDYQETTHSGYVHASYQVAKRVTFNLGYEITGDNGRTNWLRGDDLTPMTVVGDIYGNSPPLAGNPITPCPGASTTTGCIFPGPFPDQPLGPQATNWHKLLAGVAVDLGSGVQFKGMWDYYDYNSKDEVPSLSLLRVTAPRDFHSNTGTISVKYSF